uniref:Uncharacterized protein n=1 Tax=Panagrolaimus sp. JU765 TaxID=591449 RepID=A0AC34QT13_9BILA
MEIHVKPCRPTASIIRLKTKNPGLKYLFYSFLPILSILFLFLLFYFFPKKPELKKPPPFYHFPSTKNLNCSLIFDKTLEAEIYRKNLSENRLIYHDDPNLLSDCDSIKKRGGFFPDVALTKDEQNFPIAFARIVYKDYYFLETQLKIEYAPQNSFCYFIDSKASNLFKKQMQNLTKCFDNVFIAKNELDIKSEGHNMTLAHLSCLRLLRNRQWKYVILLQNHDVRIKTNAEIVKILKIYNGANDIAANQPGKHTWDQFLNWTIGGLQLFNYHAFNDIHHSKNLELTKSLVQVSISRAAVDFVFDELNVELFIRQLERKGFGVDELFWATLNVDETINLPGGFTRQCLEQNFSSKTSTRLTVWIKERTPSIPCKSGYFRRWICVFGIEDLPNLIDAPQFYANKLMSEFDFAAVTCLQEKIYNRTFFGNEATLNVQDYEILPHVRYHKQRVKNVHVNDFECEMSET